MVIYSNFVDLILIMIIYSDFVDLILIMIIYSNFDDLILIMLIYSNFDDLILIMLIYYNFDDLIHRETNVCTANKKVHSLEKEEEEKHGALIDLRATAAGKNNI